MDDLDKQAQAGDAAERFLTDPVFGGAIERVQRRLTAEWRNSEPNEGVRREKLYFTLRALGEITNEIQKEIDNGKIAKANILRYRKREKAG